MRILLLSQYYPPEVGATQNRMQAFARHLADAGHEVTVIAHVPNHPKGVVFEEFKGKLFDRRTEDGVDVCRVWVHASEKKSSFHRLTFYLTYAVGACLAALVGVRRRPDVIFATSPPLPVLLPAATLSAVYRRPYVADIRDVWPAVAVALGELGEGSRVARAAERLERWLYRRAALITVVTRSFIEHVEQRGGTGKVRYLPNGTDTEVFTDETTDPELRDRLDLSGSFVVGYFGNHGIAQGLEAAVDAAAQLDHRGDVAFLLGGEGPVKRELQARAEAKGARNIHFLPQVPTSEVPRWINVCDVLLVPLRDTPLLSQFIPSKLFDYLACAKPVILMVEGEARTLLAESEGGYFVRPGDHEQLAELVGALADDPGELVSLGRRGQAYVRRYHSRQEQAAELEGLLRAVARDGSPVGDAGAGESHPRP